MQSISEKSSQKSSSSVRSIKLDDKDNDRLQDLLDLILNGDWIDADSVSGFPEGRCT